LSQCVENIIVHRVISHTDSVGPAAPTRSCNRDGQTSGVSVRSKPSEKPRIGVWPIPNAY
jgi:hypothetical protein